MLWTHTPKSLCYGGNETLHHVFIFDSVGKLLHREQVLLGKSEIELNQSSDGPLIILSHEGMWKSE